MPCPWPEHWPWPCPASGPVLELTRRCHGPVLPSPCPLSWCCRGLNPRPALTLLSPGTNLTLPWCWSSPLYGLALALPCTCSALHVPTWAQPWSYRVPGPGCTLVLALTLPWLSSGPSLVLLCPSMPWPCPHPALALHWSCSALTLPWPRLCLLPSLVLALPWPDPGPAMSMTWPWTCLAILCPGPVLSPPCSGPALALVLLPVLLLLWPCPVFGHALCYCSPALRWPWPYPGLLLSWPVPTLAFSTLAFSTLLFYPGLAVPWPCPALALPLLWILPGSAFSLALPLLLSCPWPSFVLVLALSQFWSCPGPALTGQCTTLALPCPTLPMPGPCLGSGPDLAIPMALPLVLPYP
ncbi:LOW QUALITY PROTEIN: uncharacterized protein [Macaca fascicularis]|uniref:LOW QUALITY PROTEIN: uncharacterized protein n=1 Tax=Macaca fascicularis TaxID=9541 RepID=UPI003D15C5B4